MRDIATRVLANARKSAEQRDDLLGRLVTARDPATGEAMPDALIVDNVVTFLMAGHETTSQALTWTLYLLALFPDWQEAVRQEVLSITQAHGRSAARTSASFPCSMPCSRRRCGFIRRLPC